MFKTRKKDSIRRRPIIIKTAEESEDEGNLSDASVGTVPVPPPSSEAQAPPKKMRKKMKARVEKGPKPVLSFGHEDEEESGGVGGAAGRKDEAFFRVKKSKASKVKRVRSGLVGRLRGYPGLCCLNSSVQLVALA